MIIDPEGASIELNSPETIDLTPPEQLRYSNTGVHESGFAVDDIDHWFEKVKGAGFETTTAAPWSAHRGGINRMFLFADTEGNLIQLAQADDGDQWASLAPHVVDPWNDAS